MQDLSLNPLSFTLFVFFTEQMAAVYVDFGDSCTGVKNKPLVLIRCNIHG